MANSMDLLGALLNRGLSDSSARRIEHSLSEKGGLSDILEKEMGVAPAKKTAAVGAEGRSATADESTGGLGSLGGTLSELASSIFGDGAKNKSLAAAGLGALVGSLFGGGAKSAAGAMGGGALALLGSIALKALGGAGQQNPGELDHDTRLVAGLREPTDAAERQKVESVADLTVKAMLNAAKADGRVDEDELQRIVGELQSDGISDAERNFVMSEVSKPMNTDEIVRAVPNRQVAAQVYAASLLAIDVDTPAEKAYLEQLARALNLDAGTVAELHSTLGVAC